MKRIENMTRRLTLVQAYRRGYLAALNKCFADLRAMKERFDNDLHARDEKQRADLHRLSAQFDAEIASLQSEFAAVEAIANSLRRDQIYRAVERATAERAAILDAWLH